MRPFLQILCTVLSLGTQIILHFVTFNVRFIVIFMAWQFNAVHQSQIGCFPRGQCQTWAVAHGVIYKVVVVTYNDAAAEEHVNDGGADDI